MPRISVDRLVAQLTALFVREGVSEPRARRVAELYAQASADGVYSHGANFIPSLLEWLREKLIADPENPPERVSSFGAFERYDGRRGFGSLNAEFCIDRAMALADGHGMGAVALRNTGHWGRPGNYGWRAAEHGYLAICWTNTWPVLPPWEGRVNAIGNNPLVFAVPGENGEHLVLDMAMSQFSYGALASYAKRGQPLPVPGGYDSAGHLTEDAGAIEASQRALPIGYWKGSGLALVLDMIGAMLSGGLATHQLGLEPLREAGQSQVFLAVDPSNLGTAEELSRVADGILDYLRHAKPVDPTQPIRYPGEQTLLVREENMRLGVPVDPDIWSDLSR